MPQPARGPANVVRWLEEGLIAALASLGFPAVRRDTPSGARSLGVRDAVADALGAR